MRYFGLSNKDGILARAVVSRLEYFSDLLKARCSGLSLLVCGKLLKAFLVSVSIDV